MASPASAASPASPVDDSFIDDLIARRTQHGTSIQISGFADLNASQQTQVLARLREAEERGELVEPFDQRPIQEMLESLDCLTPPPPTEEEMIIENRDYEAKARRDLEAEGCPPCYPPDLQVPLQDIPEEYQKIISYWRLASLMKDVELLAQFRDWERFRAYQKRVRHEYGMPGKVFSEYVDYVNEVRQEYGLEGGDMRVRYSLEEKDRTLENWVEFQAYHIRYHLKELEKEARDRAAKKESLQRDLDSADAAISQKAARLISGNEPTWGYQDRELESEKYFLQWTEKQRIAMDSRHLTSDKVDHDDRIPLSKAVRRASVSDRRKRQPKRHSVLGDPGTSKRKQDVRRQKPKPAPPATDVSPPTSNASQVPDSPATNPRRAKTQKPRHLLAPQKISKAKRFRDTNGKSGAASRRRAIGQKRPSKAQSQPALAEVTTRSGRVSRPPVKWVPRPQSIQRPIVGYTTLIELWSDEWYGSDTSTSTVTPRPDTLSNRETLEYDPSNAAAKFTE
ncbi:hypothetical protein B7494_g3111 [Chlorociboria aeruginascens]|nr:hypothetical protein B7494_g3111 [Chlorociboria aeruginascens]